MIRDRRSASRGQALPMAIAILMVLTVLVPLMVYFAQRDSIWSQKQAGNTAAFHHAEAGIEKAYLYISQSTTNWTSLMAGAAQTGYNFDTSYSDVDGGTYSISITSGPASQQVTIFAVGRDKLKRETRALKAIYANSIYGAVAIYAGAGAQIGGGVNVEWGAVMSPYTIDAANRNHPQFWSAGQILTKDTDPNPPNCDTPNCWQWHSYYTNLPPQPTIDFSYYRSSAAANMSGGCPIGTGAVPDGSCYYPGSLSNWNYATAGVMFVEGDLSVVANGMYHKGSLIVMGNIILPSGKWGSGTATMTMPSDAWKQYANDWAYYRANYDSAAPATFPGLTSSSYNSPMNCYPSACSSAKLAVNGLAYVGGNFNNGGGGGGNSDIYGALYVVGSASQTASSGVNFYFNKTATNGLQTTAVYLSRISWQNASVGWPASLP